jgi:hypothetical protein
MKIESFSVWALISNDLKFFVVKYVSCDSIDGCIELFLNTYRKYPTTMHCKTYEITVEFDDSKIKPIKFVLIME